MLVDVILCETQAHFRDFLQVPFDLFQKDKHWVPPLRMTTKRILNKKNPFYKNAEVCLWVAYRNKKPVGRIAAILNHSHNDFYRENIAFWGFFESEHSQDVASMLFHQVEQWAIHRQVSSLRGPMNPSINYECGLQISAFDSKPFVMMPQNPQFYPELVEMQGFTKLKDLQAWIVDMNDAQIDVKKTKIIKALQNKYQVRIRPLNMKDFDNEIKRIAAIYNDAWQDNWGYLPLDIDEFRYLASELKSIVMANFVYIAEMEGVPCGFSVAIPDLNQVLQTIRNGKLLPFHFLKLIWQIKVKKSINQGRIALLGVLKKHQHIPIGAMLYNEYLDNARKSKCVRGEFSWILEDNLTMQSGLKLINATHYKTYRIYEKTLQTNPMPSTAARDM